MNANVIIRHSCFVVLAFTTDNTIHRMKGMLRGQVHKEPGNLYEMWKALPEAQRTLSALVAANVVVFFGNPLLF